MKIDLPKQIEAELFPLEPRAALPSIAKQIAALILSLRGMDNPEDACTECEGIGVKTYTTTTTTWRKGPGAISGQALTKAVCDKCWGSGDQHKPWKKP